jgi:hypothetical protein
MNLAYKIKKKVKLLVSENQRFSFYSVVKLLAKMVKELSVAELPSGSV